MDTNEIRQRAEAATPSPWEVGIVDPEIDPVEWFRQHLSFSESTDVWCVWCPQHPRADGEHLVLSAITGNGPDSEANAYFIANARRYVITLLDRIAELEVTLEQMEGLYAGSTQVAIDSIQRIATLEGRNKQQELSILSLAEAYKKQERRIAELEAELQAIADWQGLVVGQENAI